MFTFYSRIIVGYDASELSKKALEMAKKLAEQDERIEIHVLSVIKSIHSNSTGELKGLNEQIIKQKQLKAEELLAAVKVSLDVMKNPTQTVLLFGHPAETILEYSRDRSADLIIVGSRGLSTFKEIILGSVSHNIVQHAHCPVLVAK